MVCIQSLQEAANTIRRGLLKNPNCPVKDPQPTFMLVVLPENAAVLRREVKQWSDMMSGIATQCVVRSTNSFSVALVAHGWGYHSDKENTRRQMTSTATTWRSSSSRPLMRSCTRLMIVHRINIKCGGRNSYVVSNANNLIKDSMIVGMQLYSLPNVEQD